MFTTLHGLHPSTGHTVSIFGQVRLRDFVVTLYAKDLRASLIRAAFVERPSPALLATITHQSSTTVTLVEHWLIGHQGRISMHETFVSFSARFEIQDSGGGSAKMTPMGEMLCIELVGVSFAFLAIRKIMLGAGSRHRGWVDRKVRVE